MNKNKEALRLFRELVGCVRNIYFTEFDTALSPLFSTAPDAETGNLFMMLAIDDMRTLEEMPLLAKDYTGGHGKISAVRRPEIQSNSLGLIWVSEVECAEGIPVKIHVLGPAFADDFSLELIRNRLDHLRISVSLKQHFLSFVEKLPVVPIMQMIEYGIMQHYALTGEKIRMSDFIIRQTGSAEALLESTLPDAFSRHPHGTYTAEKKLLDMIRTGNIHYRDQLNQLAFTGSIGITAEGSPLRQAKNYVISFATLCSRAAIDGGLSPQSAFLLSDQYIKQTEAAENLSALTDISHTILHTYIYRVHRIQQQKISPQIQQVCDRLQLYPQENADIHTIAKDLGYSPYYLSRKFQQETGVSFHRYAMDEKIRYAKHLLVDTNLSIAQISDLINFCSQSYFGSLFRKEVGVSPKEYRQQSKH